MTDLIREAVEMIKDYPKEAKVIHWALLLDDEARCAFMLAWNIVNGGENET